jgi:hypothetical protein
MGHASAIRRLVTLLFLSCFLSLGSGCGSAKHHVAKPDENLFPPDTASQPVETKPGAKPAKPK